MRDTGPAPCLAACGAAIAPTAAMTAAPRNSEQKIRRNRGGINGETEFEFVIIELAMRIVVVAGIGDPGFLHFVFISWTEAEDAFKQMPGSCQIRMLLGPIFFP
jgi:hypothetical protein